MATIATSALQQAPGVAGRMAGASPRCVASECHRDREIVMDASKFDTLLWRFSGAGTRRIALTSALGGAAASGIAAIGLGERNEPRLRCSRACWQR